MAPVGTRVRVTTGDSQREIGCGDRHRVRPRDAAPSKARESDSGANPSVVYR
jgi:hypothetical protein